MGSLTVLGTVDFAARWDNEAQRRELLADLLAHAESIQQGKRQARKAAEAAEAGVAGEGHSDVDVVADGRVQVSSGGGGSTNGGTPPGGGGLDEELLLALALKYHVKAAEVLEGWGGGGRAELLCKE